MADEKRAGYFVDGAPIPMHLLLIEEMPASGLMDRFTECAATRSTQYTCEFFYKHISRPVCLPRKDRENKPAE
ncbi:MAG TPA: hypothetical protein VEZ90_17940 [Blastocatellia bacterium]|nr:hypothetical protein [Blastocatellia bacterium]